MAESANGVKYLYDIDPIEKVGQPVKSGTSTTGDIIAQSQTESQAQIRSSTLSDRDVLRIAAQMAKNSESMLDIKKSLSIADQFPGFNIISVFFLTESHSLISATASLMISAGFIRTALLWNIFSLCRVGRRRLCLTVPASEQ